MTDAELSDHIAAFAKNISQQPLGLAFYKPEAWAQQTRCFENVGRKVQQDGGRIQFGWMFQHRYAAGLNDLGFGYCIAVHHAVWHGPNGHLVDVTPFHSDAKYHPLAPGGDVLFLVDDAALPVTMGLAIAPLASRFSPVNNDPRLIQHVERLIQEEDRYHRNLYDQHQK